LLSYLVPQAVLSITSIRGRGVAARRLGAATIAALALVALPSAAEGRAFRPPHHRLFHGVSDTGKVRDYRVFNKRVGAHSALLQDFYHWKTPLTTGALHRWAATDTRGVLSLSTAPGGQPELISPRRIAHGHGDQYLLKLNQEIAASGQTVYMRLFPEMNGSWNPYCAYNPDGSFRGASHSTANFRQAWQRTVLILRGGVRAKINRKLRHRGMPLIYRAKTNRDPVYAEKEVPPRLPHPRVGFMWVPQTIASPDVTGNQPRDYWPGRHFVDWVGADIYSKYASPGVLAAFHRFYRTWDRWPFVIGEYSPWDNDFAGSFTRHLFKWALRHHRVRALVYYRSVFPNNEFDINHWPSARHVIHHFLKKHRFDPYPPGVRAPSPAAR
jgi:hypothetical protein